jgi:hypothetical protein
LYVSLYTCVGRGACAILSGSSWRRSPVAAFGATSWFAKGSSLDFTYSNDRRCEMKDGGTRMAGGGALGGDEVGIRRDERRELPKARTHQPLKRVMVRFHRWSTHFDGPFLLFSITPHVAQREQSLSFVFGLAPLLSSRGAPRVVVGDEFCLKGP